MARNKYSNNILYYSTILKILIIQRHLVLHKKEVARQEWYEWKYRNREVEDYYHHPRDDDDI